MGEPMDEQFDDADETCGECGGEGYVLADCFEDTCCCLFPEVEHGYIRCICNPFVDLGTEK